MKGTTPTERARLLVGEGMFKLRRAFPALRAEDALSLLAIAVLTELGDVARPKLSPAAMGYRLCDQLALLEPIGGEGGQ